MNRTRFYQVVIVLLLVSNLLLVFFCVWPARRHGHDADSPRDIIIRKLDMDKEQVRLYDRLIQKHRSEIAERDRQMMDCKNTLYALLPMDAQPATTDSLTTAIAAIQKDIEQIHFEHFLQIKALCRPEQLPAYEELSHEIAAIFNHPKPRH